VPAAPPEGYSTNENSIGGRLIVIAIDPAEHPVRRRTGHFEGGQRFVDRLQASDSDSPSRAIASAPGDGVHDRPAARIKQAISRMVGQRMVQQHIQNRNIGHRGGALGSRPR